MKDQIKVFESITTIRRVLSVLRRVLYHKFFLLLKSEIKLSIEFIAVVPKFIKLIYCKMVSDIRIFLRIPLVCITETMHVSKK